MMTIGSLFAGIGGLELGLERALGAETIWQVEQDAYCRKVLDKHWPNADRSIIDVREAGAANLRKPDLICGGFPCQGVSIAGFRRGLKDERSALWWEFYRILGEIRPTIVVLENVPTIVSSGVAGIILGKLSKIGYDCEWTTISAEQMGAPHVRKRWFCIGYLSNGCRELPIRFQPRRRSGERRSNTIHAEWHGTLEQMAGAQCEAWEAQSNLGRVADGISGWLYGGMTPELWEQETPRTVPEGPARHRVARLKALGNAVVPACSYEVGLRIREVLCECVSEG